MHQSIYVLQTNRTKIVSGQYIDLALLSENTNSENNDKQVVLIDGVHRWSQTLNNR
jgi:hypothetical protein